MKTDKILNIFGDEIEMQISTAKRKPTIKRGYAATPGSGPKDETCKTCDHAVRSGGYGQKNFSKCALMKAHWTHGEGTDILMRSPACRNFIKEIKQ